MNAQQRNRRSQMLQAHYEDTGQRLEPTLVDTSTPMQRDELVVIDWDAALPRRPDTWTRTRRLVTPAQFTDVTTVYAPKPAPTADANRHANTARDVIKPAANAAFGLIVKTTLFRLALTAAGTATLLWFVHELNTNAPWTRHLFGTFK